MSNPKTDQQRTLKQNNGLHKFCELLAKSLNDAGLDQRKVLKPSISIPWTTIAVKESLWKPIQEAMFNKKSTTELEKNSGEISDVHAVLMRELGKTFGVEFIPFPSEHEIDQHHTAMKLHRENIKNLNK